MSESSGHFERVVLEGSWNGALGVFLEWSHDMSALATYTLPALKILDLDPKWHRIHAVNAVGAS